MSMCPKCKTQDCRRWDAEQKMSLYLPKKLQKEIDEECAAREAAYKLALEAANPKRVPKIVPPPDLADVPADVLMGRLVALYDVTNLQCQNGNWNYDPYMYGLANGMLLAIATMTDSEYKPLDRPDEWLGDRPKFTPEVCDGTPD